MDLNNRRTGKDTTKPRALGLLGHSEFRFQLKEKNMSYKFNLRHDLSIDDHQMKCVFHVNVKYQLQYLLLFPCHFKSSPIRLSNFLISVYFSFSSASTNNIRIK